VGRLIQNEIIKIALRMRTWIMAAIVVIIVAIAAIVIHTHLKTSTDWKQALVAQNARAEQTLHDPHTFLPPSARSQIESQVALNTYDIAHNLPPGHEDAWVFAIGALSVGQIAVVFVTVVAGDIVASEFAGGTIKALLTQPVSRRRILLSKYVAVMLYTLAMLVLVLVSSLLVGGFFFGFGGAGEPHVYANDQQTITQMATGAYILIGYAFELVAGIMTVTIAFMISAVFRSSALAIAISIVTLFVGNTLVQLLSSFSWVKYVLFANTDLMQYMTGGPTIAGMTMGFSITVMVAYFVVLNGISWLVFAKRDVSA